MTEKPDPFDVAALERALNDSATRVSTIWVSYLIFALYLLIATGTATHRQLLLEEPLKLPALNIDLPLFWFFVLAPFLFVIFHLYVLLQVLLLGRTAAAYNEILDKAVGAAPENALMRQRLANTLFAQIFAGSPRERQGWLGWLLRAMAWTTLALAPIYIILAFQFVFLPYHSHFATWTHRLLLLAELAVAFLLWPLVLDARRDFNWRRLQRRIKGIAVIPIRLLSTKDQRRQEWQRLRLRAVPIAACLSFVGISLGLASFPGEPHVNLFTGNSPFAVRCDRWISQKFDRLTLTRIDLVDAEKLDKIEKATAAKGQKPYEGERTRNFRERDLTCGAFDLADLRRTDFAFAHMSGARFASAELQGAYLGSAQLQGAHLADARLQDTDLGSAQLQGTDLLVAQLQGANLTGAQLQGADLRAARLEGAVLFFPQLQGANLRGAWLQGADLTGAQFQGADLRDASLQGASLRFAQLQGADLTGAELQGADLTAAQLQGADLSNSELRLAWISDAYLWRAWHANCSDARVSAPKVDAVLLPIVSSISPDLFFDPSNSSKALPIPATREAIEKFIEDTVVNISNPRKSEVRKRLHEGLDDTVQKDDSAAIETTWRDCAAKSEKIARSEYLQRHADFLRDLVCDATTGRKEIAAGIIRNWISNDSNRRDRSSRLARGLLGDGKECAATKDLTEQTKERLREFASAPAPAN